MASSRDRKPSSFFMFCIGDFATKISIPTAFAREHPGLLGRVSVSLTTATVPGRSWDAKIKSVGGSFYIAGGWSEFVKENDLTEMKLLIFHVDGDYSALQVSVFGHDSCLELPQPNPSSRGPAMARPWTFVKTLKKYHITDQRMDLPKQFAIGTGISRSLEMTLQDGKGRMWPIKVTDRNLSMFNMSSGWIKFVNSNKLKPGTQLLFEFVRGSDNVVKVTVVV